LGEQIDPLAFRVAVTEAHYQWSLEYGDDVALDPALTVDGSDYNLHTLDVSARARRTRWRSVG
jgi:hypothetical protein